MRSPTLPESVFMAAKFQSLHKTCHYSSSSSLCFNNKLKHKSVNPTPDSNNWRYSRQWFRAEGWNGLSTQASMNNTHDIPELSIFHNESCNTEGATCFPSGSADVDISHDHTPIDIENAATSWTSSLSWMKFPTLIGMLTLLDSHQALAGSELAAGLQSLPYLGDLGDISTGFASAFLLIFFSELGDKTFFIAALLAARNSGVVIFIGTFGALALMTIISVVLGRTFHYVDDILPFRFGEADLPLDDIAAVCLLVYFGVSTLIEAASSDGQKTEDERNEAEIAVSEFAGDGAGLLAAANTVLSTFLVVFVAEWGDKSFFSTIALAAASSPLGVIGGALAGHAAATLLAVLGGSLLGTFLSEKAVAYVGGTLFLVFAGVTLFEIVT